MSAEEEGKEAGIETVPTREIGPGRQARSVNTATGVSKVSRRAFISLVFGAVAGFVAACRAGAPPAPAGDEVSIAPEAARTNTPPAGRSAPASPTISSTKSPTDRPLSLTTTPSDTAVSPPWPTPAQTPIPATATAAPAATATPGPALTREGLLRHWPETRTSRVVVVRHSGVWAGDNPDPAAVLDMLDEGLRTLAGSGDVAAIWRALFAPHEQVLLKVNCIAYGGPTQPAVTYAVARRLQDAGLAAENILIFDRTDGELESAGYSLNEGGAGVQCHGARGKGSKVTLSQASVRFYRELDACDALINLPTPKQHDTAGTSVALKNHYGSVDRPGSLHGNSCDPAIAELNAQAPIRAKTRLVVGAALQVSPGDWNRPERENALLLSFDPVALDTVGRDIIVRHREAQGLDSGFVLKRSRYLRTAQELGLGATDAALIELQEVALA